VITIKSTTLKISTAYSPPDVDQNFYEAVLAIYDFIAVGTGFTPILDEIEEWVFRRAVAIMNSGDPNTGSPEYLLANSTSDQGPTDEYLRDYIELCGAEIKRDIKKSLRHARYCYVDTDFVTDDGYSTVVRNGPFRKLFRVYDIYGKSD
jgi:hypothetical protein